MIRLENRIIKGKTVKQWVEDYPLMSEIIATEEVLWTNPKYESFTDAMKKISLSEQDVKEGEERLIRFAPYLMKVFPETAKTDRRKLEENVVTF